MPHAASQPGGSVLLSLGISFYLLLFTGLFVCRVSFGLGLSGSDIHTWEGVVTMESIISNHLLSASALPVVVSQAIIKAVKCRYP